MRPVAGPLTADQEAFVNALVALVPPDEDHLPLFQADAYQCLYEGWTIQDAKAYFYCFEEISPNLEESIALARMDALQKKYGRGI